MKKRNFVRAVALASVFVAAFFVSAQSAKRQRVVNFMTTVWDYDLNPHTASYNNESQILTSLYEGLFCYNPITVEAAPAYCKSYKVSRDKKRWTFTLRSDAKFSNGDPITAQTVKDSWMKMISNPDAPFASFADCIVGAKEYRTGKGKKEDVKITVTSDTTLVVNLVKPTGHLPQLLCHTSFAIVSDKKNVYSGPFVLKKYDEAKHVMDLEKNKNYFGASEVLIPGVHITQGEDSDEAAYLFNTGAVDWLRSLADDVLDSNSIQVGTQFGTQYYFFKLRDNVWAYPEFRQALVQAFPYEEVRKNITLPAKTLVYPLLGYPQVDGFSEQSMDDALELMADAREKYGVPAEQKIPLVIAINTENSAEVAFAEMMKTAWEPLGVDVQIQGTSTNRYTASIPYWKADIFLYGWVGDYADPLAFLELFQSGSSLNNANYHNEAFDQLLENAACADTDSQRYKNLSQAEQMLLDEGVVIPLSYFFSVNFVDMETLGGWYSNPMDIHPFKFLYFKDGQKKLEGLVFNNLWLRNKSLLLG